MHPSWGVRPSKTPSMPLNARPPPRPVPYSNLANEETDGQPRPTKRARQQVAKVELIDADLGEMLEVRFASSAEAEVALAFNGTVLRNAQLIVQKDTTSKDGTKVLVQGQPAGISNEELRTHFSGAGTVLFVGPPGRPSVPTAGGGNSGTSVAEVRYETPVEAQQAIHFLNGSEIGGLKVSVMLDQTSKDGSKILVTGLPGGVQWQDVKDFCAQGGQVAFVNVRQQTNPGNSTWTSPQGTTRMSSGSEGEVRYDSPEHTAMALKRLNGSILGDKQIWLTLDPNSKDQTRLLVSGLSPYIQWQELKDHFGCIGTVAFAQVNVNGGFGAPAAFGKGLGTTTRIPGEMYGPWGGGSKGAFGKAMFPAKGMWGKPSPYDMWASKGGCGKVMCNKGAGQRKKPIVADGKGTCSGEVRYDNPQHAQEAVEKLNGSLLMGSPIAVEFDISSKDGSKVFVHGLPNGCQWQELKDHFGQLGQVAFSAVIGPCEVRMETVAEAQKAVDILNGTEFGGSVISVVVDRTSKDGTRLLVNGLPLSCAWQEVKDLFAQVGAVAFVSRPTGA